MAVDPALLLAAGIGPVVETALLDAAEDLDEPGAAVRGAVAALLRSATRHLTGTLWQPDVVVASEQSLLKRDEFEVILAGGSAVNAKLAVRDPGTNVAALRLERPVDVPAL